MSSLEQFMPIFEPDVYSPEEERWLRPFFTNLTESVYVVATLPPELIGALCSRTSRVEGDLRQVYLQEYIKPFINPAREEKDTDESWQAKLAHSRALQEFVQFFDRHSARDLFANPRARSFYIKWLAQYGDDSIAQMAGMHLVFTGVSQLAAKHFEDQRIGLAPIEKSTRYVNFGKKIKGQYLYYVDPTFTELGFGEEYRRAMDNLFKTYNELLPRLIQYLTDKFPQEKAGVIEKKAFDCLRGLLPTSSLTQVAFFGNGQAFEYMISRSAQHPLGEIRWTAERALVELNKIAPAFLRRLQEDEKREQVEAYQKYLSEKNVRLAEHVQELSLASSAPSARVILAEYDPEGENKVIAAMLYSAKGNYAAWLDALDKVRKMGLEQKQAILEKYLQGRNARWQKVGRAFENAFVRWEIIMSIGAWRDLHRHRMHTQQRQYLTCVHGYDVPPEVEEAGLAAPFKSAIERTDDLFSKVEARDAELAQYVVTLAHRLRFMQYQNLRQCFWEMELRTIPEGHPDYRRIEQEKFRLLERVYPLACRYMLVNLGKYDFARRGQEEKIQAKLRKLEG